MEDPMVIVSSSPHLHDRASTASMMWDVSIALAPAALWGVYVFGVRALVILLISIASSVGVEFLLNRLSKESTLADGSAFLTGLLIGMNLPADSSIAVPIIASAFAMFVVKWTFGGLGANWINPALAARVFVFFSFTNLMNTYRLPKTLIGVDSVTSATMLTEMNMAMSDGAVTGLTSTGILEAVQYPFTQFASSLSSWFQSVLRINVSPYTIDAFFGNMSGCIGEVSAFLLLVGVIYLFARKIITWHIPISFLATFSLLAWVFGGVRNGLGLFEGDFVLQLFSGGMMLGAFFMATDMVTSPTTYKGMIIFGIGGGFLVFLLRYFGSLPESVSLAIIVMNIFVPTIDRYILPKRFGEVTKTRKESKGVEA
ncbi:MAG: RnfABCDGE type electron transport complex subunit D [Sphaerochaetaceae bacterium]|jgi:electron transport complex protein RnfD